MEKNVNAGQRHVAESKDSDVESGFDSLTTMQLQADDRPETKDLLQRKSAINESPQVQQLKALQRVANSSGVQQSALQRKASLEASGGGGGNQGGLPEDLRTGMEQLSGMDMGDVRVHRNSSKAAEAGALAYAQGNDIHLGAGQEQHLPHEAWHVVQQRQGRVKPTTQAPNGAAVNDDRSLESEADLMGEKAVQMKVDNAQANQPLQRKRQSGGVVQRVLAVQIELEDFEAKEKKEQEESKKKELEEKESEEKKIDLVGNNFSDNSSTILINSEKVDEEKVDEKKQDEKKKEDMVDEIFEISEKQEPKYVIGKLKIIGRPEGPHGGTMGDHTTAHGLFQKGLITQLQGKPLEEAFKVLSDFYLQLKNLPGYARKDSLPSKQKGLITNAENAIGLFTKLDANKLTPLQQCNQVQSAIQNVLQVRELLTYSTINTKKINEVSAGKGKGESAPLKVLTDALTTTAKEQDLIKAATELFDVKAVAELRDHLASNLEEDVSDYLPGAESKDKVKIHIGQMVKSHSIGLQMSFPSLFGTVICKKIENQLLKLIKEIDLKNISPKSQKTTKGDFLQPTEKQEGLAVQITSSNDGKINKIEFAGRTETPFRGTMGAHSSAWVMHQDIIVNVLQGKDFDGAIQIMKTRSNALVDLFESRKMDFKGYSDQHDAIKRNWNSLKGLFESLPKDDALKMSCLQKIIHNYLSTLNVMPGSTIESSDTGGNAEGIYRPQLLTQQSKEGKLLQKKDLRIAMLKLIDLKQEDDSSDDVNKKLLKHHFECVKEAYPKAYMIVFGNKSPDIDSLYKLYFEHGKPKTKSDGNFEMKIVGISTVKTESEKRVRKQREFFSQDPILLKAEKEQKIEENVSDKKRKRDSKEDEEEQSSQKKVDKLKDFNDITLSKF